jgi:phage tail protein X
MSIIYTTKDGDVLDQICQNYYGKTSKIVEQVIEDNPHIVELEPVFEAGVKITLPDIIQEKESETVKLWT